MGNLAPQLCFNRALESNLTKFVSMLDLTANYHGEPTGEPDMKRQLSLFLKDETAATAIEYALIAGGLSIVILAAVQGIGSSLNSTFTSVSASLK
jgi:pilus assembly protein Flp/PilA